MEIKEQLFDLGYAKIAIFSHQEKKRMFLLPLLRSVLVELKGKTDVQTEFTKYINTYLEKTELPPASQKQIRTLLEEVLKIVKH